MSKRYKVIGPCAVADVQPGGTVTREQVEAYAGPDRPIRFDVLVGPHLEPVADEAPKAEARKAAK